MRNRFFFIILTTLVLAAIGINLVHVVFFKSQRLNLIDKQISESSSALIVSNDFIRSLSNPESVEDAISKVLRGNRIGKVFVLRDLKGKIVYQSFNVSHLEAELPLEPEWVTVQTETEFVRVRNIPLKSRGQYVLQVGLVLDRNFINWEIIDRRVINYMIGIVVSLFVASVILTLVLLSPLRLLIQHLKVATSSLGNLRDVEPLPGRLTRYTRGYWAKSDEFPILLNTVQMLIDRINLNYKLTRSWTLQMAHELKTPLAIIRAETESKRKTLPEQYTGDVIKEINHMSEIINQFLEWAELESSHLQKDLHALRLKTVVKNVAVRLDKISSGRLDLNLNSDISVFASPGHLDQLITNLFTNALKFSDPSRRVAVRLEGRMLTVADQGSGIPKEVMERIGEPFNIGSSDDEGATGNGLGLAWVSTVAKLYNWKLNISTGSQGTKISVFFPDFEND